jgi:hypothetical protein
VSGDQLPEGGSLQVWRAALLRRLPGSLAEIFTLQDGSAFFQCLALQVGPVTLNDRQCLVVQLD